jgi:S-adenosylmethionine:tRNA ribosyltransferase-isomerase
VDGYSYELPPDRIAQHPAEARDAARLLVVPRAGGPPDHRTFRDLPSLLTPGDLLVVNDVRVAPARLFGRKSTGGRVEVLILEPLGDGGRFALVRGSARVRPGTRLRLISRTRPEEGPTLIIGAVDGAGRRVHLEDDLDFSEVLDAWGEMPLPPYIDRTDAPHADDRSRYQTVYADRAAAAAAPTAGLHFTRSLLEALRECGIELARITLEVGAGTFRPVRSARLSDHPIHEERYVVPTSTAIAVQAAEARGSRIVAVGTTSCRSLESWHRLGRPLDGAARTTRLFLRPGDPPQLPVALITNFHLPRSTLIALVASFLGRSRTLDLYRCALDSGYRFYSYGDASLIL